MLVSTEFICFLGYWFFHCHIDFHAEIGMALVFKIGENSDIPPVPRNFPTCGNFNPEEELEPELNVPVEQDNCTYVLDPRNRLLRNMNISDDCIVTSSGKLNYLINPNVLFLWTLAIFII